MSPFNSRVGSNYIGLRLNGGIRSLRSRYCTERYSDARYLNAEFSHTPGSGWLENLAIEHELFDWCHHPIQYRERSDRMSPFNSRIGANYIGLRLSAHPVASLAVLY